MSKSLTLEIPADVADALRLPELERMQRLRLELAVSLYAQIILGLDEAAHLADLSRWEMNRALLLHGADITRAVELADQKLPDNESLAFTSAPRLAMKAAMGNVRHHRQWDRTRCVEVAREQVAKRKMTELWEEWFPESIRARSAAFQFDWDNLARAIGRGEPQ